jgi:MFS family permease
MTLVGGSLGDRYGRRRIFAIASAACGFAPNAAALIAARALQGVGGALMTPASLTILEASFVRESDRAYR